MENYYEVGGSFGGDDENDTSDYFLVRESDLLKLAQASFKSLRKEPSAEIRTMREFQNCTRFRSLSPRTIEELESVKSQIDTCIEDIKESFEIRNAEKALCDARKEYQRNSRFSLDGN